MENILITGGSGFIGSNFIRHLYHTYPEYQIFNLDALTYSGNQENLADVEAAEAPLAWDMRRYVFIHGDVCDGTRLDELFSKNQFQLVVHFAAETHVDRSLMNAAHFIRTNIEGTRVLMEAVQKHKVPRLIHISTDEVYGSLAEGWAHEESPFRPSNPYATSKAAADLLVQSYVKAYRIPALTVRGSNNYGPYQYPEKLIPLAVTNLLEGEKIPLHGTGEQVRSWLHVNDFCVAIDAVAHRGTDGAIYNVAGEERSNLAILGLIGRRMEKNTDEHRTHVADRPGADPRYAPTSAKLERELGWRRMYSLDEHLGAVVAWYRDNRLWWEKIKQTNEFQESYQKQATAQWY